MVLLKLYVKILNNYEKACISIIYNAGNNQLNIGDKAPHTDAKMQWVSGVTISMNDAIKDNGLVVVLNENQTKLF